MEQGWANPSTENMLKTSLLDAPKHIVLRKTTLVTTSLGISHDDCTYYQIDVKTGFVIKLSEQNIERKSWLISQKEKTVLNSLTGGWIDARIYG